MVTLTDFFYKGIFIVELRPKLSVKEICDAVQVDISHALSNAC